jgi:hypothetical protein
MSNPKGIVTISISTPPSGTSYPQTGLMNAGGSFNCGSTTAPAVQYDISSSSSGTGKEPTWTPVTNVTMNGNGSTSGTWSLIDAVLPGTGSTWTFNVRLVITGQDPVTNSVSGPLTSNGDGCE